MSKKKRQQNREQKKREELKRWLPDWKRVKTFLGTHWLGLLGILVPLIAAFVIYYFTVAEPDIRVTEWVKVEETDNRLNDGISETYCKVILRFKNFSSKAGYVDRVEFNPASLSPSISVKVLDVDKVRIGWREERDILMRFILTKDIRSIAHEEPDGPMTVNLTIKAYDNTGKLILNMRDTSQTGRLQVDINKRTIQRLRPLDGTP